MALEYVEYKKKFPYKFDNKKRNMQFYTVVSLKNIQIFDQAYV
jgi:hypothetical protein